MTTLSVNVNKVATLRNARGGKEPDLLRCVDSIISCGVKSITAHPRADERHIRASDIGDLHSHLRKHHPSVEMNWEGDIRHGFLDLVSQYPPHQCTLVPVSFAELTSHRGYDVGAASYLMAPIVKHLRSLGIRVSVFVESHDLESVKKAAELGCDRVEVYTEPYARSFAQKDYQSELARIQEAQSCAQAHGLEVNAGHDLTHLNIPPLLQAVPAIAELSVGHHIISYALEVGMKAAVTRYLQVIEGGACRV